MTEDRGAPASESIMVVGGGISGLTTAIEAAEVGYEVFLVEKKSLPGRKSITAESIFSQAVSTLLRFGNQFSADQG